MLEIISEKQDLRYALSAYPERLMCGIIWHSQDISVSKAN